MSGILRGFYLLLFLTTCSLFSLPAKKEVRAGTASFNKEGNTLRIHTSKKAIINYESFNIKQNEEVHFLQPSSKSTTLNRVVGDDPSDILGKLHSNGQLFLVNPNGIYFGPDAVINTGSFLASTLNITDEDFLNDNFAFFQEEGKEASIINEGKILSSREGFITFMAPIIENKGSILARAGKVAFASAERVTLDFTGDGLIQFTIDGELEKAVIANYGKIEAVGGNVELKLGRAKDAIKMVVNTDGITPANQIEESGGRIRLVSSSQIKAEEISIVGEDQSNINISGSITATKKETGGNVHIFGDKVTLEQSEIDVSGDDRGGEVLIGGEYQGRGPFKTASFTTMDRDSIILADARNSGDGGRVILWSDDTTLFDGKIFARGGESKGDGGFVETSGKNDLGIATGFVDTSAANGNYGQWLLDPNSITITVLGNANLNQVTPPNCTTGGTRSIAPSVIASSLTNVTLCAQRNAGSFITVTDPVTMNNNAVSLTLTAGSTSTGPINLNNNLTTRGGNLTLNGLVALGTNVTLDTTNGGAVPNGANISFSNTINGANTLSLTAGSTGNITLSGAVGGTTPLTSLTATGSSINQNAAATTSGSISYTASAITINGNVTTNGSTINMMGPVSVSGSRMFDSTNGGVTPAGANITFSNTLNGAGSLTFRSGTGGNVVFSGAVGGTTPPANLTFTSANLIQVGSNITVSGANLLTFPFPVSVTGTSTISSNGANVNFNSTINGANSLSVIGGGGAITFMGIIGGTTPLISLTASGSTITQSSTATTVANLSYTGSSSVNVAANITTSGGTISTSGPLLISGNPTFDTTNGGGSPSGGSITLNGTINGASSLVLNGGLSGTVSMTGAVGNNTPLTSLTATGLVVSQGSSARTTGAISYTATTSVNIGGNMTTSGSTINITGPSVVSGNPTLDTTNGGAVAAGADITFSNSINGATALTFRAGTGGTVFLNGAIGGVTPLTNLSFTSANLIQIADNITVSGANPLVFPFPVTLTGSSNITSNNNNITFSDTINADALLTRTLRLIAGSGNIFLNGIIGGTFPLNVLAISSANNLTATTITVGSLSQSAGSGTSTFNGAVSTSGTSGINLTGNAFTFNNTVTTSGGGIVTIDNSALLTMPNGSDFMADGAFSQTGNGTVRMGNTITSNNGILFTGPVALTSAASVTTAAASQTITFLNTIDSISTIPFDLTLATGSSNITIEGDIGSVQPLGTFLVNSTNNLTIEGLIATGATLNGGTGTTTVNGDVQVGSGGIMLTGNNFVNNGNVITTDGGSVVINNSGTATRGTGTTVTVDGDYSIIGTGPAFAGGLLTVQGDVLINPAVTLVANAAINTSGGNGNITFSSTVNGTRDFTLNAGSGGITFSANVGSSVPIGNLTITSANTFSTQAVTATSIRQLAGNISTTFNGALTTSGSLGIAVTSNAITRGAAMITTGGGPITITNSGLFTSTAAGNITASGGFTQNGTGAVSFGGSIVTSNANISFLSSVDLAANGSFNTGIGIGDITMGQGIQNAFAVVLNSGTGDITLGGNAGSMATPLSGFTITRAANVSTQDIFSTFITQSTGSGTTTFNGAVNTNSLSGISLTGTSFTFNSTFTTTALGPLSVTNTGSLTFGAGSVGSLSSTLTQSGGGTTTLSGSITASGAMQFFGAFSAVGSGSLSTQAANQPITFFSTVDGPGDLTISTGTEDILFSGDAGSNTALGDVIITTAQNVSMQSFTGTSLTQSAGTGTTLFNGDVTTTGAGGIDITGAAITFLGNASANNIGTITIDNSGLFTASGGNTLLGAAGFSQVGAGNVSLGSSVSATDADISFTSAITLTDDVTLSSGTTAGDITVATVDGNFDLTFTAGQDIFAGVIGGTTRVGTVTATTVRNNNASSITAAAIVQLAGSGTTSLNGNIDTNTPTGINLVGTNFSRSGSIITTNSGSFSVTNSGSITGTAINTTSIDGSYTQTAVGGASSFDLAGTITARLGISLSSPITIRSDPMNLTPVILDTSGGNGNISITGPIDNDAMAAHTLILRSGAGDITISAAVGSTTPIGPLQFGDVNNITASLISAESISQEAMTNITGIATFNSTVTTSGVSGIVLSGNAFTFNDVTTTGTGPFQVTNSGLLTLSTNSQLDLDGSFTQNGTGPVEAGGSIATTSDNIDFSSAILLINTASLSTGAGIGDITLGGAVDGSSTLELTAGMGNISLQDTVGQITPVAGLTIQSANNILFDSDSIHAGPFTIVSSTGTTTFNGILEATAVDITGATVAINDSFTSTTGSISISNSGTLTVGTFSPITVATSFSQSGAGGISLASNISTTGLLSISSPLTLANNILLTSGGGNIELSNDVDGTFNLTLTAGTGDISLSGNVGVPRLGVFTITSANDISVQAITASSISLQNSTGTATLVGNLDTNTINGITLVGNAFTTSGTITTTNGGPLTVTNSGLITATGASTITLNGGGELIQNGTGTINLGGTITTQNANISIAGPVNVLLPVSITSNNGNIFFSNTVDGPDCPTLNAGTGDITFNGVLGGTTPLGCLDATGNNLFINQSVTSAGIVDLTGTLAVNINDDITTTGSDIALTGPVIIGTSLTLSTGVGAGDISSSGTINGSNGEDLTLTAGTGNITLSQTLGEASSFNNVTMMGNNISIFNLGSTVLSASGTTSITATTDLTFTGTTYNNGVQNYTAGNNFNFTAISPVTISSSAEDITFTTGTIQLASNLTINSFGADITLSPLLGTGVDLNINADTGDITFVQIGAMGDNLNDVTFTSTNTTPVPALNTNVFANSLTINSSTPQIISMNQSFGTVTFNQPVIIQGNISYTCGSAGTIIFNGRVDADTAGSDSLSFSLNPCGGSVIFNGPVGGIAPLSSISCDTTVDVTANNTVNVGTFSVANGTGTVSFLAGMNSTAAGGIDISTSQITLTGTFDTANGGDMILDNSSTLTISSGSSLNISGSFQQTGGGAVNMGGNITTNDGNISFTGGISLSSTTNLTTVNATGANISLSGTINGSQNLTLRAGAGDISFSDVVGGLTPLSNLQITSTNNLTASAAISAATVTQAAGSGTSSFDAITTTGLNGIDLTGTAFTFSGNITTMGSGPLLINNSGSVTFNAATHSIAGALTQNGAGSSILGGDFTVGGAVSFAQDVTLADATSFNTSTNSMNIIFSGDITNDMMAANALTLTAGSGSISCVGTIGSTPIGALTIGSAENVSFGAISASSITQTAGTGTTTISGNLSTTDVAGIDLTGTNFSINSTITTTNAGAVSIAHTGLLSLVAGSSSSISGSFSESGLAGVVSLSGTIATSDQNISFANPITLTGNTTLSSGSGAGTITLSSTVDGNRNLSLTAGTGNISLNGNLGDSNPIGTFTISSVNAITYPSVHASSITQTASSGTTTITGPFHTTGLLGVSISGGIINQNGAINTFNEGPVAFVNSGTLTIANGANTVASGSYSQSGGGSVSLGGSITAVDDPVFFTNAINLTADVSIVSGPITANTNNITFSDAITGANALSVTAMGGTIVFGGDIGTSVTPLSSFTITNAANVNIQSLHAGTIVQQVGTGETTFNGAVNATTLSGISLSGTDFTFNDTVDSSGPFTITNSGTATFNVGATTTITGAFLQNGVGDTVLSNNLTSGGRVDFHGAVSAVGTGSIDTSAANQAIMFFSSVDGPGNLTLASGLADIDFLSNIGETTSLGDLTISTVANLTTRQVIASSITQSAGTGLTLFRRAINTNGVLGIDLTGTQFTFSENITTTGGGPITLNNSGILTTTLGKSINSNGIFTQNGTGSLSLASTIQTTNANAANAGINFSGSSPITLTAPVTINSSTGGGTINFSASSTVNGSFAFTLNAGSGNINILGDLGGTTRLGAFTMVSANDIQAQAITAASISQLAGSGTSSLLGAINTNTPAGMTFIGNNFTTGAMAMSITTTNGGPLTFVNQGVISGNAPVAINIDGAFVQNGPGTIFVQNTTARQGFSFAGPVIVPAAATLDSSSGSGNMTFSNIVSGLAGTEDLILTAGTGNITFNQPIGLTTTVGAFNVTELGSLTASGESISIDDIGTAMATGVANSTSLTALGEIVFTGTIYNANAQDYDAALLFEVNSGGTTSFSSNGSAITFQNADIELLTGSNLSITTGGVDLTLPTIHAQAGNQRILTLDSGAGSIDLTALGTEGNGEFASATFTGTNLTFGDLFADAFTFNYTGTLNAGGNIISVDTPLSFSNPVVLQGSNTFSTFGSTGNNISFSDTLNGAVNDAFGLTLNAGGGDITFSGNVGNTGRLQSLVINAASDVTLVAPSSMTVGFLVQQSGSGTTTFNGPLIVPGVIGIMLTGNNFTFNSTVQTLNNASLTVANSGTLAFAGTATLSGAFTQSTSNGPVALSGSITANQPIFIAGPITLSGTPSLDTSGGNQTILLSNTLRGSGGITLNSGSGNITLQANVGTTNTSIGAITITSCNDITAQSVFAQSLDLQTSTGLARVNGQLNTTGAAGINLVGNNFLLNGALTTIGGGSVVVTNSGLITGLASSSRVVSGSYTQNGTGPVNFAGSLTTLNGPISFSSAITCLGSSTFDSSNTGQNVTFGSTIDGPAALIVNAGTGDITFSDILGADVALSNLTVSSSNDINLMGVGTTSSGVEGILHLQASNDINLSASRYTANSHIYSAGNATNVNAGSQTTFTSFGESISFPSGTLTLASGSDLVVLTNDGDFSYSSILGSLSEIIIIDSGSGISSLNTTTSSGSIIDFVVAAGRITFSGPITAGNIDLTSLSTIANNSPSYLIQTPDSIFLNGLGGNVGTLDSPIFIQSGGQIFVGAGGSPNSLAVIIGSSSDNTVHAIPSNPPCKIIFNGVVIKDCGFVPPFPPGVIFFTNLPFAVPGFDSSYFNLSDDYFFLPFFLDKRYVKKITPVYWTAGRSSF